MSSLIPSFCATYCTLSKILKCPLYKAGILPFLQNSTHREQNQIEEGAEEDGEEVQE